MRDFRNLIWIWMSVLLAVSFTACSDEKEEPEDNAVIKFYCINGYKDDGGYILERTYGGSLNIMTPFTLFIKGGTGNYTLKLQDTDLAEIEENSNYEEKNCYRIIPKEVGKNQLTVTDEDGEENIYEFYINMHSENIYCGKAEIEMEVEDKMIGEITLKDYLQVVVGKQILPLPIVYSFYYHTPKSGELYVRLADEEKYSGSFLLEKGEDENYFIFNYNEQTFRYKEVIIPTKASLPPPSTYKGLACDLTKEYQEKYPDFQIDKITIVYSPGYY